MPNPIEAVYDGQQIATFLAGTVRRIPRQGKSRQRAIKCRAKLVVNFFEDTPTNQSILSRHYGSENVERKDDTTFVITIESNTFINGSSYTFFHANAEKITRLVVLGGQRSKGEPRTAFTVPAFA